MSRCHLPNVVCHQRILKINLASPQTEWEQYGGPVTKEDTATNHAEGASSEIEREGEGERDLICKRFPAHTACRVHPALVLVSTQVYSPRRTLRLTTRKVRSNSSNLKLDAITWRHGAYSYCRVGHQGGRVDQPPGRCPPPDSCRGTSLIRNVHLPRTSIGP